MLTFVFLLVAKKLFGCSFESYFLYFEFGSGDSHLQDSLSKDVEQPSSLLEAYHLRDKAYESSERSLYRHIDDDHFAKEKEVRSVFFFCYFFLIMV